MMRVYAFVARTRKPARIPKQWPRPPTAGGLNTGCRGHPCNPRWVPHSIKLFHRTLRRLALVVHGGYAREHIIEWPVAESTRTLTVSPATTRLTPAKIAVLNC